MQSGFPRISDELESLVHATIGCCITVHRALGPGFQEVAYSRACAIELHHAGISFETERSVPIIYRDQLLCHQRIDLLVDNQLVLEVKSVEAIHPVHVSQVVGYMRVIGRVSA